MRRSRAVLEIAAWATTAAAGHLVAYRAQREVFLAGVPPQDPYLFPRAVDVSTLGPAVTGYAIGSGIALVVWVVALIRSRSAGWRAVAAWPLALAGVGYVAALVASPGQSIDVLSYLAHGYLAATGANPYLQPAADVAGSTYGAALIAQGWAPVHPQTPYGPLWTHLEELAYAASGGDVRIGLLLLKLVAFCSVLASVALIFDIVRRVRPGAELTAALGFAWCPVVVVQFGLDGHNDALAVAFVLLAIWATVTGRAWLMVLALGAAALTKITPLMFGPPLAVLLLRRGERPARTLLQLAAAAGAVGAATFVLWRPWWSGSATLDGLRYSTTPYPGASPAGWVWAWFAEQAPLDPSQMEPDTRPQLVLTALLIVVVLALSWQARLERGLMICGVIALVALALVPVYWPWYVGTAVAILGLRPSWVSSVQLSLLAAGATATGLLGDLAAVGAVSFEDTFARNLWWGLTLPVAGCAVVALLGWLTSRSASRPSEGRRQEPRTAERTAARSDAARVRPPT